MTIREYIEQAIAENRAIEIEYVKYDGTGSKRQVSDLSYSDEYGDDYIVGFVIFETSTEHSRSAESGRLMVSHSIQSPTIFLQERLRIRVKLPISHNHRQLPRRR